MKGETSRRSKGSETIQYSPSQYEISITRNSRQVWVHDDRDSYADPKGEKQFGSPVQNISFPSLPIDPTPFFGDPGVGGYLLFGATLSQTSIRPCQSDDSCVSCVPRSVKK